MSQRKEGYPAADNDNDDLMKEGEVRAKLKVIPMLMVLDDFFVVKWREPNLTLASETKDDN